MQATLTLEEASTTLTVEGTPPTTIPELQCPQAMHPTTPQQEAGEPPPAHFRLLAGRQAMEVQEMPAHHSLRERAQVRVPAPRLQGPQLGHPWAPQVGKREHRTSPAGILRTKEGSCKERRAPQGNAGLDWGLGGARNPQRANTPTTKTNTES